MEQDYPSRLFRVVVVDNDSVDETPAIVRTFPVHLAFERSIQSAGAARNRGIACAQTDLIAFIDSDCLARRDWLSCLVAPFSDPKVGVVGGTIGSQPHTSGLVERFLCEVNIRDETRYRSSEPKGFPSGNVAYRRAALNQVGTFDAFLLRAEDVDLAWRVQAYGGWLGIFAPNAVVLHKHDSTLQALFRQYRRYGLGEVIISTLYRGEAFHQRTPARQLRKMMAELGALLTYSLSFCVRLVRIQRWHIDPMYLAWPVLWSVLQTGHLVGTIEGLARTRWFRCNPYATNEREVMHVPSLDGPGDRRAAKDDSIP
jgi:cellulose synthase/poly-beta-1,6-N-acetylglucosamine synthase-like glycosyltransferase